MSNDISMRKRRPPKKTAATEKGTARKGKSYHAKYPPNALEVQEPPAGRPLVSMSVMRAGKRRSYAIRPGFGYFILSLRKVGNLAGVTEVVEAGMRSREVEPIIKYLDLKVPDIARAASVSPSTVSRWKADSSIGVPGSNQFFRMDEIIRKGVEVFGGLEEFKGWLQAPNLAMGKEIPASLIISQIGVELVDEALDALHYGNVM
jgi:putative toxin-antitoxin system antitoxin component (TIGR02293 family)